MKFYKYYWLYFVISACFLIPGLLSLFVNGFRLGIDFTGGSILTIQAREATQAALLTESNLRAYIDDRQTINSIKFNDQGQAIIRTGVIDNEQKNALLEQINSRLPVEAVSFEAVGATMGSELMSKTFAAIALASLVLVGYLYYRFNNLAYGLGALLGVVHDVTIICGIFSLLGWWRGTEVDSLFVTAMLTTISFSVHDTVVIYDRIRELQKKFPHSRFVDTCEAAVMATISRSFNNSLTVCFMLLSLLLLGGVTLRSFALALLLGVVFGTYSSPFTSIPLLILFDKKGWFTKNDKQKKK
ncbi:protein translocase subunit SecF [bacterium]|nr:protein translocase subunit SecF [bacterium]